MTVLKYLGAYSADTRAQVADLLAQGRLGEVLKKRYGPAHGVRTDRALYDYTNALKSRYLRHAEPLAKVMFDPRLELVGQALGTHTTVSRVQGNKLKAKREIRVASLFKDTPPEFLKMIVVHELAHMKERDHGKAFYALCTHMEPAYHQYEFDLRLYLTQLDATGDALWAVPA